MFKDRKEGGERLSLALEKYQNKNVIVLGILRGGVETAYYVARYLNADFSVVVSRKLGYPFNPEVAFGALAEDNSYFMLDDAMDIDPVQLQNIIEKEKKEIVRRVNVLRKGKPLPDLKGRTVILVDDGIATGATLFASINLCKNQKAGKIIVASPVSGKEMKNKLSRIVDEAVILETPGFYHAVSQAYKFFDNLTDAEVLEIMRKWNETKLEASIKE